MSLTQLEVLVEEASMERALRILLPKIVGAIALRIYSHQGKDALLERLPNRLRGYQRFLTAESRILIVLDRDNDDCRKLKQSVERIISDAGLRSRSEAAGGPFQVLTRIAVEELEAWYFGDWAAVCGAYPRVPRNVPSQSRYRDPDAIAGGTWEAFERIMQKAGYFEGGLRKIAAAERIAPLMNPVLNTSRSFRAFHDALAALVTS